MSKITVVGCGVMGSCLIRALMKAGNEVVIVDLNKTAAEPFVAKGAKYSANLQDAPETEVVLLNTPSHAVARKVVTGCTKERLCGKMLINTTTCGPKDVEDMAEIAKEYCMKYLEAKIECYPQTVGTESGYLVYSGSKEVFDATEHMLKALGRAVYLGENAKAACVTDISMLGVHYGAYIALIEAAALCVKNDYSMKMLGEQIKILLPIQLEENYVTLVDELSDYTGEFPDSQGTDIVIEERGARYVKDAMNSTGVNSIFTDWLLGVFKKSIDAGDGHKNMVALIKDMFY